MTKNTIFFIFSFLSMLILFFGCANTPKNNNENFNNMNLNLDELKKQYQNYSFYAARNTGREPLRYEEMLDKIRKFKIYADTMKEGKYHFRDMCREIYPYDTYDRNNVKSWDMTIIDCVDYSSYNAKQIKTLGTETFLTFLFAKVGKKRNLTVDQVYEFIFSIFDNYTYDKILAMNISYGSDPKSVKIGEFGYQIVSLLFTPEEQQKIKDSKWASRFPFPKGVLQNK